MCKNFKYHSSQCSKSPSTPTTTSKPIQKSDINGIIAGLITKLETQLGSNVDQDCGQKLLDSGRSCLTTAQNKIPDQR